MAQFLFDVKFSFWLLSKGGSFSLSSPRRSNKTKQVTRKWSNHRGLIFYSIVISLRVNTHCRAIKYNTLGRVWKSRVNFQRVCLNGKQPVSYYFSLPGEWQSSIFPNRSADWSIVPLFSSVMSPLLLRSVLQDFFRVTWDEKSSKRITSGVFGGGKTGTLNTASLGSSCWE